MITGILSLLLLAACGAAATATPAPTPTSEPAGGSEAGEHDHSAHDDEHGEHGGGGESDGLYGLDDTYDQVRGGARLTLSYDQSVNAFVGVVKNITGAELKRVRVEVHLSNGVELGPTAPVDLAPGAAMDIALQASGEPFETWSAHPEVD